MKSLFGSGALIATGILLSSLILFTAKPSAAESTLSQTQQPTTAVQNPELATGKDKIATPASQANVAEPSKLPVSATSAETASPVTPPVHYVATAYSLRGRTASGRMVSKGLIAADPRVLPLGSRVKLEAGGYSGDYLVADTGGAVRGKRIDIWTPTTREAMRFGRRLVKLTVLSYGPKRVVKKRVR